MEFIETSIFTTAIRDLIKDDEYRSLQIALLLRPEQGKIIPGSGGLRKVRWGVKGRGKRGGCRVIYYWDKKQSVFFMLYAYPKGVQGDLTPSQAKTLKKLVREELK